MPSYLVLYEENYPFVSSVLAAAEEHSRAQPVLVKKVIADCGARSVLGGGALGPGGPQPGSEPRRGWAWAGAAHPNRGEGSRLNECW